jgi:hypothetical protein
MVEEAPLYETTYALVQTVREALLASGNRAPDLVTSAWTCVHTLREVVSDALRARDTGCGLRRLRDAEVALDILRRDAYDMLRARALSNEMFDELMRSISRCRDAVCRRAAGARHEAWARINGYEYPRRRRAAPPRDGAGAT